MKRYVLTGAPGAGKTSVLRALEELGFPVVEEAATDVIAAEQQRGIEEPWEDDGFIDKIVTLQRQRTTGAVPGPGAGAMSGAAARAGAGAGVQVHDRSVLCTLALARFLGRPVTPLLAAEVDRVVRERVQEREVFLIRPIGFVERTAARRISYESSLAFERLHDAVYREHGYEIVDIAPGAVAERAAMIAGHIAALASGGPVQGADDTEVLAPGPSTSSRHSSHTTRGTSR
jgi:predicted ATPase